MCKEFQEVDNFAAGLLIDLIKEPSKAPIPRLNPFTPVVVGEEIYRDVQVIHQTIQYLRNPNREVYQVDIPSRGSHDSRSVSVQRERKIHKKEHAKGRYEQEQSYYDRRRNREDSFSSTN